jgi:oligopeptide transport system ATP-binding protein
VTGPPDAAAPLVVEVEDLTKSYPLRDERVLAVDRVSFRVAAGECLGIVGESGSGKTTLAKLLLGLEPADGGRIAVSGRDRSKPAHRRGERRRRARELQLVFQDPFTSLDPRQTPSRAVDEVLKLHFPERDRATREARVAELMDQVGLDGRQRQALPKNLSGGQRQRVAIARALAAEAETIILDEAVSGLDVSIQAQILNLLTRLQEEVGVAYLFISHDLAVIRQVAHSAIVMKRGRVVEAGSCADVLDHPSDPYTRMLRAAVPHAGWVPPRRDAVGGAV